MCILLHAHRTHVLNGGQSHWASWIGLFKEVGAVCNALNMDGEDVQLLPRHYHRTVCLRKAVAKLQYEDLVARVARVPELAALPHMALPDFLWARVAVETRRFGAPDFLFPLAESDQGALPPASCNGSELDGEFPGLFDTVESSDDEDEGPFGILGHQLRDNVQSVSSAGRDVMVPWADLFNFAPDGEPSYSFVPENRSFIVTATRQYCAGDPVCLLYTQHTDNRLLYSCYGFVSTPAERDWIELESVHLNRTLCRGVSKQLRQKRIRLLDFYQLRGRSLRVSKDSIGSALQLLLRIKSLATVAELGAWKGGPIGTEGELFCTQMVLQGLLQWWILNEPKMNSAAACSYRISSVWGVLRIVFCGALEHHRERFWQLHDVLVERHQQIPEKGEETADCIWRAAARWMRRFEKKCETLLAGRIPALSQ
eukprot:NODE_1562_length_1494_cov_28.185467_g1409_i0.p1 GENE.NODE_1562_length_1494_cov_28.185467_g1409_i0~~NODE_1562_length_1494_cov_28.185467_g1409_i0.p1  ORF type:complete len:426 (-),score=59.35 NODE_1562_length_1494_cov_28.185467_g1409_i0:51-1328(-)